jgi:hypothetical protein
MRLTAIAFILSQAAIRRTGAVQKQRRPFSQCNVTGNPGVQCRL